MAEQNHALARHIAAKDAEIARLREELATMRGRAAKGALYYSEASPVVEAAVAWHDSDQWDNATVEIALHNAVTAYCTAQEKS